MIDWRVKELYSNVSDKVSSVIFAKKIAAEAAEAAAIAAAEEEKKKRTLIIVLVSVGVALVAAIAAAAIVLSTRNKEGERRGKVLVMKIKSKLPAKKKKENACEELAEDACVFEELDMFEE